MLKGSIDVEASSSVLETITGPAICGWKKGSHDSKSRLCAVEVRCSERLEAADGEKSERGCKHRRPGYMIE